MHKAVFIDKDGTLIPDIPYNADPSRISIQRTTAESMRKLKEKGYLLIVVSNQSGVAHGYFKETDLNDVEAKLQQELAPEGVKFDGIYFCPHHPEGRVQEYTVDCDCRKPKPGMLLKAAASFNIDLTKSWMIGDILHDVEAGNKAGCRTILLDNGHETEWVRNPFRYPTEVAYSIPEAVSIILNQDTHEPSSVH